MPQLELATYPGQLLWLFVSFFVLWFGLHAWIVPRFSRIFEKRHKHVETLLTKASTFQTHAENLNQQAKERLDQAKLQATNLRQQTLDDLERERRKEQTRLSTWLHQEREALEHTLEETRKKTLQEIPKLGPSLGTLLFERLSSPSLPLPSPNDSAT